MRIDRYFVFETAGEAEAFVRQIDAALGDSDQWAVPNINPYSGKALVPCNDEYLAEASHLFHELEELSQEEAMKQGWAFGHHRGKFAKARVKLEEAQLLRAALDSITNPPNFPAYRSIFFGLLSATYSVKEALRHACTMAGSDSKKWWNEKWEHLKSDELLNFFYELNNGEKHEDPTILVPRFKYYSMQFHGVVPEVISSEGAYIVVDEGTPRERRLFLEEVEGVLEPYLLRTPAKHQGKDISDLSLPQLLDLVLVFYEQTVFEARQKFEAG